MHSFSTCSIKLSILIGVQRFITYRQVHGIILAVSYWKQLLSLSLAAVQVALQLDSQAAIPKQCDHRTGPFSDHLLSLLVYTWEVLIP